MITLEQALTANYFHYTGESGCTRTIGPRNGVTSNYHEWRRNGATKIWKTRPGQFRIPVKHGMYTHDYITDSISHCFHIAAECPLNDPNYNTLDLRKKEAVNAE